ncbi:MAG: MFS transporter [Hyphomicrobiaceae bacterium]
MTGAAVGSGTGSVTVRAPATALAGWVLVDWAVQPFHTQIVTFLFAPYFTTAVVGDAARGQALWGYAAAVAGVLIATGGPVLGAMADRGRRKPWVAASVAIMAVAAASLWYARPGVGGLAIFLVLVAFVIATAMAEFTTVFTNSLMPKLVPPNELGRLSGTSWAVAFAGGLLSLIIMAGFIVSDPATGKTLMGLQPLVELDAGAREGDRMAGPFAAIWLLIFIVPFFLFVPDARAARGIDVATKRVSPFADLWVTLKALPSMPSMLFFLIARALYTDGLSAIFVFGGIYGTAVFGWELGERGLFGIVLIVAGVIGASIGGILDDKLGSKRVIIGALVLLIAGAVGILSVTSSHVLFSVPVAPKVAGAGTFASAGEQVFLAFACLVAVAAAPNQSASRSLLARLAPPDQMARFFGLFAFSGKVTAFLAPLAIALVTQISGSQRLGMATILLFLIAGIVLLWPVSDRREGNLSQTMR